MTRFKEGDEVLFHSAPLRYQGTWAERALAGEAEIGSKPASVDWPVAGALPVPLLTAAQAVALVACPPTSEVLVHGAGGVTGGLLVVMAAERGWHVVATSSSEAAERVRGYGAVEVMDYRTPAWRQGGSHQERFAAAINAVRDEAESLMPMIAHGGQLVTITGDAPPSRRGIAATNAYVRPDGAMLERASELFARRRVTVPVAEISTLADAGRALDRVVRRAGGGIRVIKPTA